MRRALLVAALVASLAVPAAASGQSATAQCSPAPTDCSGWYAVDVNLSWSIDALFSEDCNNFSFTRDGVQQRTCFVRNSENVGWTSIPVTVRVDKTPPVVAGAAPSRGPDSNGWYRGPVGVTFFGTDVVPGVDTSGVAFCTSATYGGPDASSADVLGQCWDRAGNVSAPRAFGLRYDATPPSLEIVSTAVGDRVVRLRWVSDAAAVEVWRSPGLAGAKESRLEPGARRIEDERVRNGRRYDYRVRAVDDAGNAATRILTIVPGPRLIAPATGARAGGPPLLRWTRVRGARYYNVQLFHDGRKVLSAWPGRPRLQLARSWRFRGDRLRLEPGRYRWLVWPGRGPRSRNDYGPLIGHRTFTVAAK